MIKHPPSVLAYFHRVGAEILNFRRAMVKSYRGAYYIERALIRISKEGLVTCSVKEFAPTEEEQKTMAEDLSKIDFPRSINARTVDGLPFKPDYIFYDRSEEGGIIMVQQRKLGKDGLKRYVPWVFMSDGEWVAMEPDGALPFWKPKEGRGPGAKIMIHEGAKAAKAAAEMAEDHPWYEEASQYEHWGMIGGALAPHRTDYEELRREAPTEVVYVCDNDHPGMSALQKVSQAWGKSLKGIRFGDRFPQSFDMADAMPKSLFNKKGRYLGPQLSELIEPATWATELVPPPGGKGRPSTQIRPEFSEEWLHCVTPEVFVHRDWPNRILGPSEFNNQVKPFSHVDDTARILQKEFSSKANQLKYVPGLEPGVFAGPEGQYINTYCPSIIRAEAGDVGPWIDFMENLIPNEADRFEVMRWCATLIARPDIKMLYGLLLISETQGVGKGTLGEKVLTPLIGERNVSTPSEQEVVESQYNYWMAHKRLAVIHEIYAGQSSKAYNKLKSIITDRNCTVQKKYQANYDIECWLHVLACSNSHRALKLSMDDRRWLVPGVSEDKRPHKYWDEFNTWLIHEGGLGIIKQWAFDFVKLEGPVEPGAAAPWTNLKRTIVEEGYSPGQTIAARTLEQVKVMIEEGKLPRDTYLLDVDLVTVIRNELYEGRHNDRLERPATIRTLAKAHGWHVGETRASVKAWGPASSGARVLSLDPEVAATPPADLGGERASKPTRPLDVSQLAGM